MPTIQQTVIQVVRARPDQPFVIHVRGETETELCFGDLLRQAWVFRDQLAAAGVQPGEIVLIILKHHVAQYPCFLGAMLLGAIPAFMPFRTPKQDPGAYWTSHRQLFQRMEARTLVTFEENLEAIRTLLPELELTLLTVEAVGRLEPPTLAEALSREFQGDPDSVAFLQHSSGTTGLKKGVMLTHRAVLHQVAAYGQALYLGEQDSLASWLPLYHDMGLIACFITPLVTGRTVVALDPFEWVARPTMLLDAIARHRSSLAWLPNFAFQHLARCAPEGQRWDLSSIRALINCSEPCKPMAFDAFLDRFQGMGVAREALQVCYAMAETVFAVTQTPLGLAARTLTVDPLAAAQGRILPLAGGLGMLSCGTPLAGTTLEILGEDGQALPEDQVGEVAVISTYLFGGYYRLPEVTAERLRGDRLLTGDLGFLHDGELFIAGRKDDQLTIYGQNHYAHDLEACLQDLPGLTPGRCVAVARPREALGSREAVVIVEAQGAVDAPALRRAVKQRVLDTLGLTLAEVVLVERGWLVKTTSGKLNRQANLDRLMALQAPARPSVSGTGPSEGPTRP